MRLFFEDEGFDGQLQCSVGKADSGMANVGECLTIAAQITPGDRDIWYQAWTAFASRLVHQADAEGAEGHCEGMAPIVFWTAAFDWLDAIKA
jgi:hypothetical protein